MFNRWFNAGVVGFWLVAMSWLLSQKVIPPLMPGDPPDYQAALAVRPDGSPPEIVCWNVDWNGRFIGIAASRPVPNADGTELRSVIRFTKLPVREMLGQLLGKMALLLNQSLGDENFAPNLVVSTRMQFDSQRKLQGFQTVIDLPELPRMIDLDAQVSPTGKLKMKASAANGFEAPGAPQPRVTFRQELDLPPDALVGDSLAPRAELRNLKVGQQWTIPTYRPFPPNSPVQILLAKVERREFITWNDEPTDTLVVAYHDEAGSGLGSARGPIGRAWVEPNGTILRQEVMLSSMKFTFERVPPGFSNDAAKWLDDEAFAPHFAEFATSESKP
ncbi:MAG TPA: hypothetical protein VL096_03545 [Pirellulaceae bacterium]|nr:hypothetical protein [Pirellulaceae bacterium]